MLGPAAVTGAAYRGRGPHFRFDVGVDHHPLHPHLLCGEGAEDDLTRRHQGRATHRDLALARQGATRLELVRRPARGPDRQADKLSVSYYYDFLLLSSLLYL